MKYKNLEEEIINCMGGLTAFLKISKPLGIPTNELTRKHLALIKEYGTTPPENQKDMSYFVNLNMVSWIRHYHKCETKQIGTVLDCNTCEDCYGN